MHSPSLRVIIYLNLPAGYIPRESFRPGPSYSNSLIGETSLWLVEQATGTSASSATLATCRSSVVYVYSKTTCCIYHPKKTIPTKRTLIPRTWTRK